jgi:hypothetical protein
LTGEQLACHVLSATECQSKDLPLSDSSTNQKNLDEYQDTVHNSMNSTIVWERIEVIMRRFFRKHWRKVGLIAMGVPLAGYIVIGLVIGQQVRSAVSRAQSRFPGESVMALTSVASSDRIDLSERNRAIWALGQLGVPEALPVLESLRTGTECDHDSFVCQYELAKAIKLCSGDLNISAAVWRYGEIAARDVKKGSPP